MRRRRFGPGSEETLQYHAVDGRPRTAVPMTLVDGGTIVAAARRGSYAIVGFNVSNLETTQAVIAAAERSLSPVILQLSPGALQYAGYRPLTRLVFDAAAASAVDVCVHLDHCRDVAAIEQALVDGFGSVMFDGSTLDDAANASATAQVVKLASAATARGSLSRPSVEAELGVIGGREDTELETAQRNRAAPDRCAWFVAETGVDVLAPAIGNLHRMPDDSVTLDIDHLRSVARAADRPLALHGGSGVVRSQIGAAVAAGVAKINISSRVGAAFAGGIRLHWAERPDDADPRRFLGAGREAVTAMAEEYIRLAGSAGRATTPAGVDGPGAAGQVLASAPLEPE